jgi:hypothetical protein
MDNLFLRFCLRLIRPVLLVAGLVICWRNLSVSRHVIWLVLGFGVLSAGWLLIFVCSMTPAGQDFYVRISVFASLVDVWAWIVIVVGLAQVLAEFSNGRPATPIESNRPDIA